MRCRIGIALVALVLAGCKIRINDPTKPPPIPPPPVVTPTPKCAEGQHTDCWTERPDEGWKYACRVYDSAGNTVGVEYKARLEDCAKKPEPPPVPPPPNPPPVVVGELPAPPLLKDEALKVKPGDTRCTTWNKTNDAVEAYRLALPGDWRSDGACLLTDGLSKDAIAKRIDRAYDQIGAHLQRAGVRAASSIDENGKRSDGIFVNRSNPDGTASAEFEETRVFEYARACAATGCNAVQGVYVFSGGTATSPPTNPSACPFAPCPELFYPDGVPRWRIDLGMEANDRRDPTPRVKDQQDYCDRIGMGWFGPPGAPGSWRRNNCDFRLPGHPERQAIEEWAIGLPGPPSAPFWEAQGGTLAGPEVGWANKCEGDGCKVRACNRDRTVCSEPK